MWKYFKPLAGLIKRCCMSSNTNWHTSIKLTSATTPPRWWCPKNTFSQKVNKMSFEWKKSMILAFSHFNNYFVTHCHILAIFNILDLLLSELSHHIAKAPSIPKHIFKVWKEKEIVTRHFFMESNAVISCNVLEMSGMCLGPVWYISWTYLGFIT